MAPASNSSKSLQQNRPRPTVPRAIVPAIPLPYIQKRKQQQAAREKASEEAVQATQAAVVEAPSSPTPPSTEIATSVINGSDESHATKEVVDINDPPEVEPATAPVFEVEEEAVDNSANGEPSASIEEETKGKQHFKSLFW
jgi:hypothetical protein